MRTISSKSGKQILLRSLHETDAEMLYAYAKSLEAEDTFVTLDPNEPVTWEEQSAYVKANLKKIVDRDQVWLMAFEDDVLIGASEISRGGKRQRHVGRFGISIQRDYRGDGIGEQLMQIVVDEARQVMDIRTVVLTCFANNLPAQAMYEKLGFQRCGTTPLGLYYSGEYLDQFHYFKHLFEE